MVFHEYFVIVYKGGNEEQCGELDDDGVLLHDALYMLTTDTSDACSIGQAHGMR